MAAELPRLVRPKGSGPTISCMGLPGLLQRTEGFELGCWDFFLVLLWASHLSNPHAPCPLPPFHEIIPPQQILNEAAAAMH